MTKKEVTYHSQEILDNIIIKYGNPSDTQIYLSIEDSPYMEPAELDPDGNDTFGEYNRDDSEIVIYWKPILNKQDLIRTILHEYKHHTQTASWFTRYYTMGHTYVTHPYEVSAREFEEKWTEFL